MKDLKSEIEKIISEPDTKKYSIDYVESLLSLFKQQMKEIIGDLEEHNFSCNGSTKTKKIHARNGLRKEILKNIESL